MEEHEQFLIRFIGGPLPGDRFVSSKDVDWPLPEKFKIDKNGVYYKVSESQLPPLTEESRLVRGAQYDWKDNYE